MQETTNHTISDIKTPPKKAELEIGTENNEALNSSEQESGRTLANKSEGQMKQRSNKPILVVVISSFIFLCLIALIIYNYLKK